MIYAFKILAGAFTIYSLMCAARIVLTWIPGASVSAAGRFLAAACDPFLNFFRVGWLRFGALDFSPLLALAILSTAAYVMQTLALGGRITAGVILALLIQVAWQVVGTILIFLAAVLGVRLVVFLTGADRGSTLWAQIDVSLNPLVYSITRFFSGGRPVAYKSALILSLVLTVLLRFVVGPILIGCLVRLCALIPF